MPSPACADSSRSEQRKPGIPHGNSFARKQAHFRRLLLKCVSDQDFRDIADALKEKARNGNVGAMKLFFQYILGKPAPVANPDTLDHEEWKQFEALPTG